jgi:sphingosine-1-phosphate phosphatase 1
LKIISLYFLSFLRIWNVDGCVARKVAILWAYFMYIGQATKDILAIPRPSSPPVLQLEKR